MIDYIEVGSIVQLNSNGPWMTVEEIELDDPDSDEGQGKIRCVWFEMAPHGAYVGDPSHGYFRSEALTLYVPEEEGYESSW